MIKLASLALVPVLAATFFSQQESLPQPLTVDLSPTHAEQQDRQFLAELGREQPARPSVDVARADEAFLANLLAEDQRGASAQIPVMRAIPIERPTPIPVARVKSQVVADEAGGEFREVRKALPISRDQIPTSVASSSTNLRGTFRQSFITLVNAPAEQPDRTTPGNTHRASITILGDSVVVRQ